MSDIPSQCTPPRRPTRRRSDKTKLPTPPPDPTGSPDNNRDFLDYLETLQHHHPAYSRSTSTFSPVIATDEAFDHLDKLYRLMEQMLELREQNAKLHRRIRDLEHFNNLQKMNKQLEVTVQCECPDLDKDTAFAETILESILAESKKDFKPKSATPTKLRPSILRRHRSVSTTMDKSGDVEEQTADGSPVAKVSKWTKVKAAFRWEKASNTVADNKSQDSGVSGLVPNNVEIACYLRVPTVGDEFGHSPADSGAAGISTPGSLSTNSSTEDFHRTDLRTPCEDFRSSEEEHHPYIPHPKDDSGKQKFHHRTPWAKMKDIIQPRNSFKKKQRLSAQSDDIQIDVELCSDNEEVFEDDCKNKQSFDAIPTPTNACTYVRSSSDEIPSEVLARYQQIVADENKLNNENMKISKWTRVKKAFLSESKSPPKSREEHAEEEVQRNYKQLQKKLSLEFQGKVSEWERLKQNSPSISNPSTSGLQDETLDATFMKKLEEWEKIKQQQQAILKGSPRIQMTREYDLPPGFKKKLQEWGKIKKSSAKEGSTQSKNKKIGDFPRWKSLSGHRSETSQMIEYPQITDEFRKKLEEWKQIKANNGEASHTRRFKEKTPSPKLSRKNSNAKQHKKQKEEIQWFEKELGKIEKEKQRLEKERHKFMEREEKLSKLRKTVVGDTKKDILIHTPSGFYRFEGISKKFTQKLYEWEKAQGIKPEASTFALLSSSYIPDSKNVNTTPLLRSRSADSIAISALNLTCPLLSQQPSSLSLNNVEDLEKECLQDSKASSMQYLLNSREMSDNDEPEALIVEVEDYEEETAAPLQNFFTRGQKAVYHHEESQTMCEGETVAAPKIQRSESTRAQINYNIIEDIFAVLKALVENEQEIKKTATEVLFKEISAKQVALSNKMTAELIQLQEANLTVASTISKESSTSGLTELLEAVQDLSAEILQIAEKLHKILETRTIGQNCGGVFELIINIQAKMFELRRNLSYICAASDVTNPDRKKSLKRKKAVHKTISSESKDSRGDTTTSDNSQRGSLKTRSKEEGRYIKADIKAIGTSQGAIKKKIKYRKCIQEKIILDTDEEDNDSLLEQRKNKPKRLSRTRSTSESNIEEKPTDKEIQIDEKIVEKVVVPTETNFVNHKNLDTDPNDSPVQVFVKTTRKLFTPIGESNVLLPDDANVVKEVEEAITVCNRPPLPVSPAFQRKLTRDVSPNIKLMMAKYNQKLCERENSNVKSGGSSGSGSPILWRSPTAERRVKAQTERYQEVLSKLSPLLGGRKEVQKSASVTYLHSGNKQVTVPNRLEVQKSSSASVVLKVPQVDLKFCHSPEIRQKKIQQAKEEFLRSNPAPIMRNNSQNKSVFYPRRDRLSQISVESESSSSISVCTGALIKSASVGMINIDPDTYRQIDPEMHGGGYVSLPRNTKKPKEGLFTNITAKFRKVKMRRGKEREMCKMSAVSTLCRQSLVVDINRSENNSTGDGAAMMGAAGGAVQRSKSKSMLWMLRKNSDKK